MRIEICKEFNPEWQWLLSGEFATWFPSHVGYYWGHSMTPTQTSCTIRETPEDIPIHLRSLIPPKRGKSNDPCSSTVQSTVTSYSTRHWLLLQLTWVKVAHDPKCWRCHHPRGSNKTWLTVVQCHWCFKCGKIYTSFCQTFWHLFSILRLQSLSM